MIRNRSRRPVNGRSGVAAAELAVCLPVIILLVLAMIECCTMIFLKQSLTVASYEGIRTALQQNASAADVQAACNGILTDRRVQGGVVTIRPNDFQTLAPGQFIEVIVSAPSDPNSVIPASFFNGRTLSGSAEMMKEF